MQTRYFVLAVCLFFAVPGMAQQNAGDAQASVHHSSNTPKPGYDVKAYLAKNLKYPAEAKEKKIEGTVLVKFMVNVDGKVSNAKVERGIGAGCDEEAVRVVLKMPKWVPGEMDGQPMSVSCSLPVVFKL